MKILPVVNVVIGMDVVLVVVVVVVAAALLLCCCLGHLLCCVYASRSWTSLGLTACQTLRREWVQKMCSPPSYRASFSSANCHPRRCYPNRGRSLWTRDPSTTLFGWMTCLPRVCLQATSARRSSRFTCGGGGGRRGRKLL